MALVVRSQHHQPAGSALGAVVVLWRLACQQAVQVPHFRKAQLGGDAVAESRDGVGVICSKAGKCVSLVKYQWSNASLDFLLAARRGDAYVKFKYQWAYAFQNCLLVGRER